MHPIREVATITSKGQVTVPKPIRQLLGVDSGGKVRFTMRGSEVVVTRMEDCEHQDPAIAAFLSLLEKDLHSDKNISDLPEDLARSMHNEARHPADLSEEIEGDVGL